MFRKTLGINQRSLGVSLGFSAGLAGQIEAGILAPTRKFLTAIADTYGVSADWLLYGQGDMLLPHAPGFGGGERGPRIDMPDYGKPMHGVVVVDGIEFARIRRYALSVSAGTGLGPAEDGTADAMLIPRNWLMRERLAADLCVLVRVQGDSMAPAIPDGAMLLLNCAERWSYAPGIYAFTHEGEAYAKRLAVTGSDAAGRPTSLLLISDNPAYPPRALAGEELASLKIVGRVRAVFAFL